MMAVPKHNETYREFLVAISDGQPHRFKDIVGALAHSMGLTEEQMQETIPSKNNRFYSNLTWTAYNLKKAGLIQSPVRGSFVITKRGQKALESPVVDDTYVKRLFPLEETTNDSDASVSSAAVAEPANETPPNSWKMP